jgi:uncharacterized protein YbaR (Trm112 family)
MKEKLNEILACPDCKCRLIIKKNKLVCEFCRRVFGYHNGIPILFAKYSSETFAEGKVYYANIETKSVKKILKSIFAIPRLIVGRSLHDCLKEKYIFSNRNCTILNLGSGLEYKYFLANMINFDIFPHSNADVCGDAHYLPFLDNSFDVVWLCAVLEHLRNPFRVATECHRVLKYDGFILVTTPFIQPLHGSPQDYYRYTYFGLKEIFKDFKEIKCGISGTGPIGTWITITISLFDIVIPVKEIAYAFKFLISWMFFPFIVCDFFLQKKPNAHILVGGICYLGKK